MFWNEIGSGFGEPGGTPLPKIPRSTPPPPLGFELVNFYPGSCVRGARNGWGGGEGRGETDSIKKTLKNRRGCDKIPK